MHEQNDLVAYNLGMCFMSMLGRFKMFFSVAELHVRHLGIMKYQI